MHRVAAQHEQRRAVVLRRLDELLGAKPEPALPGRAPLRGRGAAHGGKMPHHARGVGAELELHRPRRLARSQQIAAHQIVAGEQQLAAGEVEPEAVDARHDRQREQRLERRDDRRLRADGVDLDARARPGLARDRFAVELALEELRGFERGLAVGRLARLDARERRAAIVQRHDHRAGERAIDAQPPRHHDPVGAGAQQPHHLRALVGRRRLVLRRARPAPHRQPHDDEQRAERRQPADHGARRFSRKRS